MVQDNDDFTIVPQAPLTNNHFLLPLSGDRYAPRTLTSKARHHDLRHFLEVYDHLCSHYKITSEAEKCKGILAYCSSRVAKMIEQFPSYIQGSYSDMTQDLYYFLADEDNSYSISKIEALTKKWRKRKIETLEQFKHYHRKYFEVMGKAIGSEIINQKEYNRYFWEGLHHTLRRRIEDRLSVLDPDLDVSVPFDMSDVIKAVKNIFNRKRFDQHLISEDGYGSDSTEPDDYKVSNLLTDSEDEKNNSDDSDSPRRRHGRKRASAPQALPRIPPKKDNPLAKKVEDPAVAKLTQEFGRLKLHLMQRDPMYRDMVEPPRNQYGRNFPPYNNTPMRNPPQFNRTPFNYPPPQQFNNPSPQYNNPHIQYPPSKFNPQPSN